MFSGSVGSGGMTGGAESESFHMKQQSGEASRYGSRLGSDKLGSSNKIVETLGQLEVIDTMGIFMRITNRSHKILRELCQLGCIIQVKPPCTVWRKICTCGI